MLGLYQISSKSFSSYATPPQESVKLSGPCAAASASGLPKALQESELPALWFVSNGSSKDLGVLPGCNVGPKPCGQVRRFVESSSGAL